eukprot:CAMPEP_0170523460 /NCGR_PEP_ID=MMETSP0209-20121228/8870_1 /TAXON_ID=665100 ORGANISM="Litonotus pictus, Strain P1" /NCGR_SAMPLE_ID=MMETSP0209 /ASSEMBLY_ACC=CAM_ASM_000301 /LENGTH=549 /DNA_ID=CAMNT_0010811541 /DNA_START=66 /DNA_END=1715 /DNA_ORIENTATION=-
MAIFKDLSQDPKTLFKAFYHVFEKFDDYDINTEAGVRRFRIFEDNINLSKSMNEKLGKKAYGVNMFSDLTLEEYRKKYIQTDSPFDIGEQDYSSINETKVSDDNTEIEVQDVDWTDYMQPVQDQGGCGSCWAFAAVAAAEGAFTIKTGISKKFSEQFLVDHSSENKGCSGGYFSTTTAFIKKYGLQLAEKYPYKAREGLYDLKDEKISVGAYKIVKNWEPCYNCDKKKWTELVQRGPGIVGVDASTQEFKNYSPDSLDIPLESNSCNYVNHMVTAVGTMKNENDPLAIVRNSWGDKRPWARDQKGWGVNGYFAVPFRNHCFVMNQFMLPVIKEGEIKPEPEPSPAPPTPDNLPNPTPTTDNGCPKLYDDIKNFNRYFQDCTGIADSEEQFGSGRTIKGWSISSWSNWEFYEKPHCQGKAVSKGRTEVDFSQNPYSSETEFRSAMNKHPKTVGRCVLLFSKPCYGGAEYKICTNTPEIDTKEVNITEINSLYFPWWMTQNNKDSMVFFEKTNFEGESCGIKATTYINMLDMDQKTLDCIKKAKSIAFIYT